MPLPGAPQGRGEGGGALIALLRREGDGPLQHPAEPEGDGPRQLLPVIAAGGKPDQGHPQPVEVGAAVGLGVAVLLRRGGGPGAHLAGVRVLAGPVLPGDAEVDQPHPAVRQQDDIPWLDVPVDHRGLLAVQGLQQGAELLSQPDAVHLRAGLHPLPVPHQGLPGQEGAQKVVRTSFPEAVHRLGHGPGQQGGQPDQDLVLALQILRPRRKSFEDKAGPVRPAPQAQGKAAVLPGPETGLGVVLRKDPVRQDHPVRNRGKIRQGTVLPAHSSASSSMLSSSSPTSSADSPWVRAYSSVASRRLRAYSGSRPESFSKR